jgi:acyl carrier protein
MSSSHELVFQLVNEVLVESGKPTLGKLDRSLSLRSDLGFDSLELAILVAKIESATGIDVFADRNAETVGDVVERICQ